MKRWLICSTIVWMAACSSRKSEQIIVPEFDNGLYQRAMDQVDQRLQNDRDNKQLVDQKILYCQRLDWPEDCLSALQVMKKEDGLDLDLLKLYMEYYSANRQQDQIVQLIDQWKEEHELSNALQQLFIESLITNKQNERAKKEIRDFLSRSDDVAANEFVAAQFLRLGDTTMAVYHGSKVWKVDPSRPFIKEYGKLLMAKGYTERGVRVLETFNSSKELTRGDAYEIARFYENHGLYTLARSKLRPYGLNGDSLTYIMGTLYQKSSFIDSAIMYMDTLLSKDDTNIAAWVMKGELFEERNWLTSSLRAYQQAYALDSADTSIRDQVSRIQGKIAYLQRRKFEESKTPLLQLESKKISNE